MMEDNRKKRKAMDINQTNEISTLSALMGSPSYSPLRREDHTEMKVDHDEAEEDEEEEEDDDGDEKDEEDKEEGEEEEEIEEENKVEKQEEEEEEQSEEEEEKEEEEEEEEEEGEEEEEEEEEDEDDEEEAEDEEEEEEEEGEEEEEEEEEEAEDEEEEEEEEEEEKQGEKDEEGKEEEEDTEDVREARRKAKGKAKALPSPEDDSEDNNEYANDDSEDNDDDDNDDDENHLAADRTSSPVEAEEARMKEHHWVTEAYKAMEIASRQHSLHDTKKSRFGDADAAMNAALYSAASPPSSNDNQNANPNPPAPTNSPSHHQPGPFDYAKLVEQLSSLQQQPRGRGRGRGRGTHNHDGWGLEWQETTARETVENQGWYSYDNYGYPATSSASAQKAENENMGWEVYDEAAWERAAQRAAEQEAGKVRLKVPQSAFSAMLGSGRTSNTIDLAGKGEGRGNNLASVRRRADLVRAVRAYKAILPGTFLTYEKDDVMEVVNRFGDGKLFTLIPLKAGSSSGRAHTKNFVPVTTETSEEDGSTNKEEMKGW